MQLKPVNEERIDFRNSWSVKHLFNNNSCKLTKVYRFSENKLLQDAYGCACCKSIDLKGMVIKNAIYPYVGLISVWIH